MFAFALPAIVKRFLPHGLIVLAVLAGVWFLDHRGYQRAKADAETRLKANAIIIEKALRKSEARMTANMAATDSATAARVEQIETINRTIIQPTLTKEFTREIRFTDPAAGISDELRAAINTALNLIPGTGASAVDGSLTIPLPAPGPARDQ
jgi:hypothetical protein